MTRFLEKEGIKRPFPQVGRPEKSLLVLASRVLLRTEASEALGCFLPTLRPIIAGNKPDERFRRP
jgi:hypothetical protein